MSFMDLVLNESSEICVSSDSEYKMDLLSRDQLPTVMMGAAVSSEIL